MPKKEFQNLNRLSKNSALIPVVEGKREYLLPFTPTDINATFIFVKDKDTNGWYDLAKSEAYTHGDKLVISIDLNLPQFKEIYVREVVSPPSEVVNYTTIRALTIEHLKQDQTNAVNYLKYFYDLVEKKMLKMDVDAQEKRTLVFPSPRNNSTYVWSDADGWQLYDLKKWETEFETIRKELHDLVLAELREDAKAIENAMKTTVEVYAKEKLDIYTETVIKPGITNYVDNELFRINELLESMIDKVFAVRGEIPNGADWHTLEDGLWTVTDFKAGNYINAPQDVYADENSGYVQMFTDRTSGYKVIRYMAGETMFFAMYRSGVWTDYSKVTGQQLGNSFKINQPNHGFIMSPVRLEKISDVSSIWVGASARKGADGIATRIDDNNFLLTVGGEIVIPVGAVDDKGEPILEDEYYFTSELKPGFLQKDLPFRHHQSLLHVAYTNERGKVGDVKISPVFDQTPTFVDEETQQKLPVLFKEDMYELEYTQLDNTTSKTVIGAIKEVKESSENAQSTADSKVSKTGDTMTGVLVMESNPAINNDSPAMYFTPINGTENFIGNLDGDGLIKVGQGNQKGTVYTTGFKPTPKDIGAVNVNDVHNTESPNNNIFGKIPKVGEDGVMEIGRYLDFHYDNGDTLDYSARISVDNNGWFNFFDGGINSEKGIRTNHKNDASWDESTASFFSGVASKGWGDGLGKLAEGRFALEQGEWVRYGIGHYENNFVIYSSGNGITPLKFWKFNSSSGDFTSAGRVIETYDVRLEEGTTVIHNALDKIKEINGYTYVRKDTGTKCVGLVAKEVQRVMPEAVAVTKDENNTETLGVAYSNLVGLLVEGIKELKAEIEELKKEVKNG